MFFFFGKSILFRSFKIKQLLNLGTVKKYNILKFKFKTRYTVNFFSILYFIKTSMLLKVLYEIVYNSLSKEK